jgi:hypothetical protein
VLIPSRFCLVIITVLVHDVIGDTVLADLVEVDSIILNLADRNYITSTNAYEKLMCKCSSNCEAFKYLTERMHDVSIQEKARDRIHDIISVMRARIYLSHSLGI